MKKLITLSAILAISAACNAEPQLQANGNNLTEAKAGAMFEALRLASTM